MKFFLGGVNGSGKTTLLLKIKEAQPGFEIIKGSQFFMNFLGINMNYEALRQLPHQYALNKLGEMMEVLIKKYDNIIVDSHYLNLVRGKTKSVTGDWIKNFDALLLLKISPKIGLERISSEPRDRALFPENISTEEMDAVYSKYIVEYENEFQRLANKWQLPAKILDGEKNVDEIVGEFLAFDRSLRQQEYI